METSEFKVQVLAIDGMHCDACVRRVTQALGSLPGVRVESVKIGEARVLAEPACDEEIRGAIASAGFNVTDLHASS